MLPQVEPAGLCWKNIWYCPANQQSPLGSLFQPYAGEKRSCGRQGRSYFGAGLVEASNSKSGETSMFISSLSPK